MSDGREGVKFQPPTRLDIEGAAAALGLALTPSEADEFLRCMERPIKAYETVAKLPNPPPATEHPRRSWSVPSAAEAAHGAWYVKTTIEGARQGKLQGKRVAIKDNICVADVPMMNGSRLLEGFTPEFDATAVARILAAGGDVVGKAHCESWCFSGGSHTNEAGGPIENPWRAGYTSGGSSSGCAALVATGEVDLALGCDQAGSIRIPAAFCGICGLKPTHGLVPYTGMLGMDPTLDYAGPMSVGVRDNATLLEVIAGEDGLDSRQPAGVASGGYVEGLNGEVAGLSVGLLREGFGHENSQADVDRLCRGAIEHFRTLGVTVKEVSVPWHLYSGAIRSPIVAEGTLTNMLHGNGFPSGARGYCPESLIDAVAKWRQHPEALPDTVKYIALLGQYAKQRYGGTFYARAQNLARRLRDAYDAVLEDVDVLAMPTLPLKATPIPPADAPKTLVAQRAHEMFANTGAFNATGHPALSIPCAQSDGLPIGLMLVGRAFDEATVYRLAYAWESSRQWRDQHGPRDE